MRQPITAKGKDVSCIGGGDTGTDCVGTSMRQGCKSLSRSRSCPSRRWIAPRQSVARVAQGLQDGLRPGGGGGEVRRRSARLSNDRQEIHRRRATATWKEWSPCKIEWEKNDKGQFVPVEMPGSEKEHPAQLVLLAMGFLGPRAGAAQGPRGRKSTRASNVKAEHGKFATSVPGVFAAGDAAAGRAWWCGRSTKAAAPRASATAT